MVRTSVIIPTYKRKESLLRLLTSLLPQMDQTTELIIVEQGENNGKLFRRKAKEYGKRIQYFCIPHANLPAARNIGVKHANGEYCVFYDDDAVLLPHALGRIGKIFQDKTIGVVGGRVLPEKPGETTRSDVGRISLLGQASDGFSSTIRQEVDTVIGCHMAIRKSVYTELGGFDEQFTGNGLREESDFCLRAQKRGHRIVFHPAAEVMHVHQEHGGSGKADNRMNWYYHYFHNETYFFLKHRPEYLLPLFLLTKTSYILRCMFGIGREVSVRSFTLPWRGIAAGIRSWKKTKPVVIGVDAGALAIDDDRLKVGVWRVSFEFLRALSCIDTWKCWRLYSFRPIPRDVMRQFGAHVENRVLTPSLGYMKFRLPLELLLHPVDAFLGLSQALPVWHGKKIGVIHDLRFRHHVEEENSGSLKTQTDDCLRRADRIITVSRYVKDDIIQAYGVPEDHIIVAYSGVTKFPQGHCKKRNRPYFLFVGSLRKGKNIPELLEAFGLFSSKIKGKYDLVLVGGDKWYDTEIDGTIQKLNLKDNVNMMGHVSDSELVCLYRHATGFVTATKMEGFCLPIVEAMAYGCPVIAPRVGAIPEIVGSAGIVYPAGNRDALVRALVAMTDPKKRKQYKKLGYVQAKKFSWQKFAERIAEIF